MNRSDGDALIWKWRSFHSPDSFQYPVIFPAWKRNEHLYECFIDCITNFSANAFCNSGEWMLTRDSTYLNEFVMVECKAQSVLC